MDNSKEFEIEVFNSNGEQQEIEYSGNTPDLSELPRGMYTIRFRQGEDSYTERLIKD